MAPRPVPILGGLALALALPGCALVPRSRVDDAHRLVQSLRAENAQLKDSALGLRVQNTELAQRAVDDARAIKALEVANGQYARSIEGYQEEREAMRTAFRDVERQARGGGSDPDRGRADAGADAGGPGALAGAERDDAIRPASADPGRAPRAGRAEGAPAEGPGGGRLP